MLVVSPLIETTNHLLRDSHNLICIFNLISDQVSFPHKSHPHSTQENFDNKSICLESHQQLYAKHGCKFINFKHNAFLRENQHKAKQASNETLFPKRIRWKQVLTSCSFISPVTSFYFVNVVRRREEKKSFCCDPLYQFCRWNANGKKKKTKVFLLFALRYCLLGNAHVNWKSLNLRKMFISDKTCFHIRF